MQQRERGLHQKGTATPQPLEVAFPAGTCIMAGQLASFKLPTGQDVEWQVHVGGDNFTDSVVILDGNCIFCLDVQAPPGTSLQTKALQVTGGNGLQYVAPGWSLAGYVFAHP